jgi:hypothetical protein
MARRIIIILVLWINRSLKKFLGLRTPAFDVNYDHLQLTCTVCIPGEYSRIQQNRTFNDSAINISLVAGFSKERLSNNETSSPTDREWENYR